MSVLIPTTITVTLNNDQIKALPTTAVEIIPAPGANKRNMVIIGQAVFDFTHGIYTNIGSVSGLLMYPSQRKASLNMAAEDLPYMFADDSAVYVMDLLVPEFISPATAQLTPRISYIAATDVVNRAVQLKISNDLNDFTGGHADNTLKVTVLYLVIDV